MLKNIKVLLMNPEESRHELFELTSEFGTPAQVSLLQSVYKELASQERMQTNVFEHESSFQDGEFLKLAGTVLHDIMELVFQGSIPHGFVAKFAMHVDLGVAACLSLALAFTTSSDIPTRKSGWDLMHGSLRTTARGTADVKLPTSLVRALKARILEPQPDDFVGERQLIEMNETLELLTQKWQQSDPRPQRLMLPSEASLDPVDRFKELWYGRDIVSAFADIESHTLSRMLCHLLGEVPRHSGDSVERDAQGDFTNFWSVGVRDELAQPDAQSGYTLPQRLCLAAATSASDVVEIVKSCSAKVDWLQVFEGLLELPSFQPSKSAFYALLDAHRAALGMEALFPLSSYLRPCRNTGGQLKFLYHAIKAGTDAAMIDFSIAPPIVETVPGLAVASVGHDLGGPKKCWACCPLLTRLFKLAEVEDYNLVRGLFDEPLTKIPATLLITVCLAKDDSRGALRSELLRVLVPPLFDVEFPLSTVVQKALADRAHAQLRTLLRSIVERDVCFGYARVGEIITKPELAKFCEQLLKGPPCQISFYVAVKRTGTNTLCFPKWLKSLFVNYKDTAAFGCARWLEFYLQGSGGAAGIENKTAAAHCLGHIDGLALCTDLVKAMRAALPCLSGAATKRVEAAMELAEKAYPEIAITNKNQIAKWFGTAAQQRQAYPLVSAGPSACPYVDIAFGLQRYHMVNVAIAFLFPHGCGDVQPAPMCAKGAILCFIKMLEKGIGPGYASKLIQLGWETIIAALKRGGMKRMMNRLDNPSKFKCLELADELTEILRPLYRKQQDDIIAGLFSSTMMKDCDENDKHVFNWRAETAETNFEKMPAGSMEIKGLEYFDNAILMAAMIRAGVELAFEAMEEVGMKLESAHYESLLETPLIANTIARKKLYEMNKVISDTAEHGCYLYTQACVPLLKDFMSNVDTDVIGKRYNSAGDNAVDNKASVAVTDRIQSRPVEVIGRAFRGRMTAMKNVAVGGSQ